MEAIDERRSVEVLLLDAARDSTTYEEVAYRHIGSVHEGVGGSNVTFAI